MPIANELLGLLVVIGVLLVGVDFIARSAGSNVHTAYRRVVRRGGNWILQQLIRFAMYAWRNYRQFIIGILVGMLLANYSLGRLP